MRIPISILLKLALLYYAFGVSQADNVNEFNFGSLKDRFRRVMTPNRPHMRNRRTAHFDVRFPVGTNLEVAPGINFPIHAEPKYGGKWQLSYRMGFPLPPYMVDPDYIPAFDTLFGLIAPPPKGGRKKRHLMERINVYDQIANGLQDKGLPGQTCVLRTICELREAPLHIGLIGDMINVLFSPSFALQGTENEEDIKELSDYFEAENIGHLDGDCHKHYFKCPQSLFDMIPGVKHHVFTL